MQAADCTLAAASAAPSPSPARPRIFVQIPSYRDRECQWTVKDLFDKARHPERVFVGICWQFDPETDQGCFDPAADPGIHAARVRRVDFHASQAIGLGWARAQAQTLWRGEEYTLQIDSHMRFVPDWDALMLEELAACPSPRPVLTIYPPAYWPPDQLEQGVTPLRWVQGVFRFSTNGIAQCTVHHFPPEVPVELPKFTASLAGGFVFAPSAMIEEVPSDPNIYFEGEEPNLALRLWTNGFDLFSPRILLLYHYYRRIDSRRPWDDATNSVPNAKSLERMRQLCEPGPGDAERLGRYGVGKVRTLEDFEIFSGLDYRAKSVASYVFHYPHVYTDEMAAALVALVPLKPLPDAHLFLLGDGGFLFSTRRRAFYAFTPVAAYCWCAMEAGMPTGEIIAGVAARTGFSHEAARRIVYSRICHWHGLGVLEPPPNPVPGFAPPTLPEEPVTFWKPSLPAEPAPIERVYQLLGMRIRIRSFGAAYDALARTACGHLPELRDAEPSANEHRIDLFGVTRYHYAVCNDRYPPPMVEDRTALASLTLAHLQDILQEDPGSLLHVRGALIEGGGGATLVLGRPDLIGKVAARSDGSIGGCHGGWAERAARARPGLLEDLRFQLERDTGLMRPIPKAIFVAGSSFDSAPEHLPPADSLPGHGGFSSPEVRFLPFDKVAAGRGVRVTRLILVKLEDGAAKATFAPATAATGLTWLIGTSAPRPALATVADAAQVVAWVDELDCFELTARDSDQALALLVTAAARGGRIPGNLAKKRQRGAGRIMPALEAGLETRRSP
jgi:hypothetical protein